MWMKLSHKAFTRDGERTSGLGIYIYFLKLNHWATAVPLNFCYGGLFSLHINMFSFYFSLWCFFKQLAKADRKTGIKCVPTLGTKLGKLVHPPSESEKYEKWINWILVLKIRWRIQKSIFLNPLQATLPIRAQCYEILCRPEKWIGQIS